MIVHKSQSGFGLVEVLVSLLLLAISILGFSALQMNAVKATDESLTRSTAVSAMRGLSEDVRLNLESKTDYFTHVSGVWTATTGKTVTSYCEQVKQFDHADCISSTCTASEQATFNSYQSMQAICDASMMMNAIACPQAEDNPKTFDPPTVPLPKMCLIVSWNNTLPEVALEDNSNAATSCIDASGAYRRGSSCLVMETY